MNVFGLTVPLVSAFVVVITIAVILSVITLFNYFFGGPNPLTRNTDARVEAAQNPANLRTAYNIYQRRRRVGVVFVLLALYVTLLLFAPEAAVIIAKGVWAALVAVGTAIQKSATIIAEQIGTL